MNHPKNSPPPPPSEADDWCACIWYIILAISIVLLIMLCISMFHPTEKPQVVGASLTRFDLSTNNNNTLQLDYNLTIDIDVKYSSRIFDIYYEEIEVKALYAGNRFGSVNLMPFYQGHHHKNNKITTLHPMFQGQASLVIPSWDNKYYELIDGFKRDESYGKRFDIQLELQMKVRYKFGRIKHHDSIDDDMFKCDLKRVPLITSYNDDVARNDLPIKTKCELARRDESSETLYS